MSNRLMPSLYVLDVEEFKPLVDAASRRPEYQVTGPTRGYYRIAADGELAFARSETGLPEALWFGVLTAGFEGSIRRFDGTDVVIGQG